ncbi:hypothetical protein [Lysobacter solisilvae (ex Woo and Kim 2020)]|uniref:Uncharacterized protein n=1 Tax=Agrilutibacter terrestris TaxID=2865112 RepID=A0A7H0FVV8_9GAMM|nr:hypothetical protein [Lysobacter terrestris]QNP40174.1 hypothetical protein H8B22_11845 [Lysobacter terrestris]
MQALKFFALSSLSVIAFDAVASVASLGLGFPYSYATLGSAALYIVFAYFAARMFGFWPALLLGAVMGITDVTLGWAVSWAIGPGRVSGVTLTPSVWVYTAVFAIVLGAIFGLIGGGIGALTRWRRAA